MDFRVRIRVRISSWIFELVMVSGLHIGLFRSTESREYNKTRRLKSFPWDALVYGSIDFLKVVLMVFWSGVVGPGTNDELSLARLRFALTVALRAQKLDL